MRKKNAIRILAFALITMILLSCKKDNDKPENPQQTINEEEIITTCKLQFTDLSGTYPDAIATYRDPDGDGGNAPTDFDTIFLHSSAAYTMQILLLNETMNPADTISNEVMEESTDHIFCFNTSDIDVNIVRTDSDGQYEIGLSSLWTTSATDTGTVTVTLKHQPGVKDGSCDPGDTDVEITFPIVVFN